MGRTALDISARELARRAKVSPTTISRLESGDELRERTTDAIRASLEGSGVVFIDNDVFGRAGVRLRKGK
jgi:transcriptional regulator with XRE-family HTH domain